MLTRCNCCGITSHHSLNRGHFDGHNRRSFQYKPLTDADNDEAGPEALQQLQQQQQQQDQVDQQGGGRSLADDLDMAEAAAAAEQASAAARASAAAHKEALVAASQVGPRQLRVMAGQQLSRMRGQPSSQLAGLVGADDAPAGCLLRLHLRLHLRLQLLPCCPQCFLLWFTAQYLFNASLSLTSVTSNTILSSTSSLFTFALSMLVLKEPYSAAKLASIAACIGGARRSSSRVARSSSRVAAAAAAQQQGCCAWRCLAMTRVLAHCAHRPRGVRCCAAACAGTLLVTLSDESASSAGSSSSSAGAGNGTHVGGANATLGGNATAAAAAASAAGSPQQGPSHSVLGDLLCLVSAAFYASYTIVLRKSLPDEEDANVALFFGYVGLLCSVLFAPLVALLAGLGVMALASVPAQAYLIILVEGALAALAAC